MKGNICLYLMMYFILRIYINVKNYIESFFNIYFSIVHISLNFVVNKLKFCVAVDDIYIEGKMSQNFVLSLRIYFMSKNG